MAIHYENYARFSKGQGFIGAACRPVSGQAKTARFHACDCAECKKTLIDRLVISREGATGEIVSVTATGVEIDFGGRANLAVDFVELDESWAPLPPLEEIFGDAGK